jgi:hypothetical protein
MYVHTNIGLGWSIPQFKTPSEIFLEKIKAIHETQRGVPLNYDQYPITQKDPKTGKTDKHNRWWFTPKRQNFKPTTPGRAGERDGSFCLGTARGMAFRSVFGLELPTYRKVLMDLRERIETAKNDGDITKEAEALISRTVSHLHRRGSIEQFNEHLESRYGIKNVRIKSCESLKEALDALKAGAPILVDVNGGWHWVLVHRSPEGKLWSNDPLEGRVIPISPTEFVGRFEIIVDANTGKPITPDKASSYKK